MRSGFHIDGTVPVFTLSCPGYKVHAPSTRESRTHGNLVFSIGREVIAEIAHADLMESWEAAGELSAPEAIRMSEVAAAHLSDILSSGLDSADLTEAVTDAAVVFLLAMKHQGIADPKRIPPCTVMWSGQEGRARVLLGA